MDTAYTIRTAMGADYVIEAGSLAEAIRKFTEQQPGTAVLSIETGSSGRASAQQAAAD